MSSDSSQIHSFFFRDSVETDFRHWPALASSQKAIYLFHRGHEHSGRLEDVVSQWRSLDRQFADYHFFCCDMRGHGTRGREQAPALSVAQLVADADDFFKFTQSQFGVVENESIAIAHSIGGVVASAWVHDYAPKIQALVLLAPAFEVRLYVPLAIPGLRLLQKFRPEAKVTSYVKASMLTHDNMQAERYRVDPLIVPDVSVRLLLDLHDTSKRILADASAIHVPTLTISAGSDWVVSNRAIENFHQRLSSPVKQYLISSGKYHDLIHEDGREGIAREISDFLFSEAVQDHRRVDLKQAHKRGASSFRFQQLKQSLAWWSPVRWYYSGTRLLLGTVGRLSNGIRLGWTTGFNSGAMLDHVYKNEASGKLGLGKLVDGVFLNAPGWKGIRQRKSHMDQIVDELILGPLAEKPAIHISDIACGAGRYVLDALQRWKSRNLTATLCDFSPVSIDRAKTNAAAFGIANVTFAQSNAFEESQIRQNVPQSDIGIVSGLLELFSDNELALKTLRGLAESIRPGGVIIYTNQPWHPQQELIARSLHGFDGKPWIMRCRSTDEMDQLVESAGFSKVKMLIDEQGIFTVSVAKRAIHI